MYSSGDLVPLSALQHYLYCPRQCALIHLEQIWSENGATAEGRVLHEKVHGGGMESRGRMKSVTGLLLRSSELGLSGQSDMVEFHLQAGHNGHDGHDGRTGVWHPYPVEYKRGRPKQLDADRIQLCAQALCLEEMLGLPVPEGALYYGKTRRREVVVLDTALREMTRRVAGEVHALFRSGVTPPPPVVPSGGCMQCSLYDLCMPQTAEKDASRYVASLLENT
ncbi:CRISPR-associated protein Cas4 [Desulfovibrio sp. OttesenSCG-928-I05]|nr:CRISPR-associated protein Cas4 [Desulfovibrio sp. OttesenSCG-928-I05]